MENNNNLNCIVGKSEQTDNNILNKYINCHIDDIMISGYTEKINSVYLFVPLYSWIYLIVDKKTVELYGNYGDIVIKEIEEINCNFDIEEDDIFTLTYFTTKDLGFIRNIEYCYDDYKNLIKITIFTSNFEIEFDSISFEGFEISLK